MGVDLSRFPQALRHEEGGGKRWRQRMGFKVRGSGGEGFRR